MHSTRLAGNEAAGETRGGVPRIRLRALRNRTLIDRWRQPGFLKFRSQKGRLRSGKAGVRQYHHHHVERLGDLARGDHRVEAVFDGRRRHDHLGCIAVAAEYGGQHVALLDLGRLARARPAALNVDHHQGDLAHDRKPDRFLLERIARAGSDRHCALAGIGGANRKGAGGDFVFGLMHYAADFFEHVGEVVRGGGSRRNRVHRADFHARRKHAQRQRRVAVGHNLRLGVALGRNTILEIEIGFGPLEAFFHQHHVLLDYALVLLAEGQRDLLARRLQVQAVDTADHAQREHVLAAPRIRHVLAAFHFHGNFVDPITGLDQAIVRLDVRSGDRRIGISTPHAFQQDDAVGLELFVAHPPQQYLLVEGDHQVGFVAAVGHRARSDADAVAARAGHAARRRANFGGNDFRGPDAVAHLRGNRAQRLAATLRTFAGIADDFDDMFLECRCGFSASPGIGLGFGLPRRFLHSSLCHDLSVDAVLLRGRWQCLWPSGRLPTQTSARTRAKLRSRRSIPNSLVLLSDSM